MSNLAIKQATYQDIIDLPANIVGEIINGQLETHSRPAPIHALAAGSIRDELISPFQKGRVGPGGYCPNLQTLEAYQLHDSHWLLIGTFANDQAVSIAPFAEHTFSLSDLWE